MSDHGLLAGGVARAARDRKSTRLNSSHSQISYAVFCLKKKTRSIEAFLALLRNAEVERLVDVMTAPGSRQHQHFRLYALTASLGREGIVSCWHRVLWGS